MGINYKETILLPRTEFPMKAGLPAREPEILARWQEQDLYGQIQESRRDAPLFVLHDGPPFANGDVHMGTGLNKILKDLVVKSRTMAGYRAPFIPGWDCHGLPIEFKVVKESRGLSPLEVRRKSEAYARKFIDIQRRQFQRLGVFGDWQNPYLTLDPAYEAEVLRTLAAFVEQGLVYRSKRPVYWSTGAQTALAEAEVEYEERTDDSIFVAFEFEQAPPPATAPAAVVIWTTTPWTLPANTAIALHPAARYELRPWTSPEGAVRQLLIAQKLTHPFSIKTGWMPAGEPSAVFTGADLAGATVRHPFLDRTSVLVTAEYVVTDPQAKEPGTGAVHTAPGHGADDYLTGRRYDLPLLSPVDDHGRFTADNGVAKLTGRYVFDANADIVALLRDRGALIAHLPYPHPYPHCWRSKTPVVFRSVEQFFIRIDDLRERALRAIEKVEWIPEWGRNRISTTVESRPDWCISRQRSWGVPLPVFYQPDGEPVLDAQAIRAVAAKVETHGSNYWFGNDDTTVARDAGLPEHLTRRMDTIDVWIDSGVSHRAVCAKHPELSFPADLYLEATDQHRGWFQSSLMTAMALNGRSPFRTCLTHGFVVDTDGKKFSKSGAYQKPTGVEHFVERYGADLVRLWVSSVDYTDEVPFSEDAFKQLGDTYRRLRNTIRILLANLHDFTPERDALQPRELTFVDSWILHRLQEVVRVCRTAYGTYEFHRVHHCLNAFCAVELSSLYIDITKDRLYCDAANSPRRRAAQTAMHHVVRTLIRLLAPVLAFTAEEAWAHLGATTSVHLERFPEPEDAFIHADTARLAGELLKVRALAAQAVETARQQKHIGKGLEATLTLSLPTGTAREWIDNNPLDAAEFFIVSEIALKHGGDDPDAVARPSAHPRCERCWRHLADVGSFDEHPHLCARCHGVVTGKVKTAADAPANSLSTSDSGASNAGETPKRGKPSKAGQLTKRTTKPG